jgi:NhaP-type Na+/H+ or K+/H+ antiporter
MGVSAAAAMALAPLCIPPAHADLIAACAGITDPVANQACIDGVLRDNRIYRYHSTCQASPLYGQVGQFWRC